jgi:N-acetylglutamate synthase-like GNAT family acetyltransferase
MIETAALWKVCFPEGGIYSANPHVITDGRNVVSMVHWKPITVCGLKGAYIFGVATHPDYRRQGLSARLMGEVLENLSGFDAAVLIPGVPSMVDFYRRFGFTLRGAMPAITTGKPDCTAAGEDDIQKLSELYTAAWPYRTERDAGDWLMILAEYRAGLIENGYVIWDERGVLERTPVPPDLPENACAACVKPLNPQAGKLLKKHPPYINLLYN